jgi:fluoride exporter
MVNIIVLVVVGGAFGSVLREFTMQMVPHLAYNFPLDILVANLAADFLLGLAAALHARQVLSNDCYMMVGTGIMGGWSTFSSFAYGSVALISASKASAVVGLVYVVFSMVLGYIAVIVGGKLGAVKNAHRA